MNSRYSYLLKRGQTIKGRVGKYFIADLLKIGGQSVIWKGRSLGRNQVVIIKEPKRFSDTELMRINFELFETGKQILKQIKECPNVELYIDESLGSVEFLVVKYHSGHTLKKLYLHKKAQEWEIKNIAIGMLNALSCIHKKNIVHRDVKPKNILYDGKNITLIDFNTAKYFYQGVGFDTVHIYSKGGYTAPEQAQKMISLPQSDLWGFAATLLFLLTGEDPHPTILKGYPNYVRFEELHRALPPIDKNLLLAIKKCLNPDFRLRPATADEVIEIIKYGTSKKTGFARLVVKGRSIPLTQKEYIIGRSKDADIRLGEDFDPQHYISRRHARVFMGSNGKWYIQDLGSLNKTAVFRKGIGWKIIWSGYKKPSEPFMLSHGDIIAIVYKPHRGPYLTMTFQEGYS